MSKRVFLVVILLLLFLLPQNSKAIDTASIKYFPLQVGNVYAYIRAGWSFGNPTTYSVHKAEITELDTIYERIYYKCIGFPRFGGWIRADSTTGSLYSLDSSYSCPNYYYEKSVDSLAANVGASITSCGTPPGITHCYSIQQVNLFGETYIYIKILIM